MVEWASQNQYNSFNSAKGLTYYENYKAIMRWMKGETDHLPPPVEVNLDPFAECNNRCYFCVGQRYLRDKREEVGEMRVLPMPYIHDLINFLAEWGVRGLCISGGGEPSLHPDIEQMIGHARLRGLDVALVTNAVKMSHELMTNLMFCRWVALSVNAHDRDSYKAIMGTDNFDAVVTNIKRLAEMRNRLHAPVDLCCKYLLLPETQNHIFDACKLAEAAGASFVGREVTRQAPALKNLIRAAMEHDGFSFVEVMSDCTEIYGRKNDLGESPEMILSQKADMRPEAFGNVADQPFRPNRLVTGVLAKQERPEYGRTYRARAALERAKKGR